MYVLYAAAGLIRTAQLSHINDQGQHASVLLLLSQQGHFKFVLASNSDTYQIAWVWVSSRIGVLSKPLCRVAVPALCASCAGLRVPACRHRLRRMSSSDGGSSSEDTSTLTPQSKTTAVFMCYRTLDQPQHHRIHACCTASQQVCYSHLHSEHCRYPPCYTAAATRCVRCSTSTAHTQGFHMTLCSTCTVSAALPGLQPMCF
jgi:hypothetical protein